jgi:hypothetical protein
VNARINAPREIEIHWSVGEVAHAYGMIVNSIPNKGFLLQQVDFGSAIFKRSRTGDNEPQLLMLA